jgi:hypothetical protein
LKATWPILLVSAGVPSRCNKTEKCGSTRVTDDRFAPTF